MTKYCVDADGNYLGAFVGYVSADGEFVEPKLPAGAIEVLEPPQDGGQVWQKGAWQPLPANHIQIKDQRALNDALQAEGSIVRALGLVLFNAINAQNLVVLDAVNELRVKALLPPYTVAQFRTALTAKQGRPFYALDEFVAALQAQMR